MLLAVSEPEPVSVLEQESAASLAMLLVGWVQEESRVSMAEQEAVEPGSTQVELLVPLTEGADTECSKGAAEAAEDSTETCCTTDPWKRVPGKHHPNLHPATHLTAQSKLDRARLHRGAPGVSKVKHQPYQKLTRPPKS